MPRADRSAWAQDWLLRACVALPLVMLAANVLAWLRWGTDLPDLDDWRAYDAGTALSLSLQHLFRSINNTIAPVGLALDVLAQRWLGGNPLPYQTLSMLAVLGGLLALQWRLLGWVVRDRSRQALAFAFAFLMLQPGTYWGRQNLAYHQALPLLALLGAACVALTGRRFCGRGRLGLIFGLGLLAGLSYISGAIAALVLGVCWLVLGALPGDRLEPEVALRLRSAGRAMSSAGGLASTLQIYLTRGAPQQGHPQYMGITWPDHLDFWVYLTGKIGRGTGQAFASNVLEAFWVLLLIVILVAAAVVALRAVAMPGDDAERRRWAVVFLPLCGVVLAYLVLVSLGRAGYREPSVQGASAVFRFAYERFHFFWVTLLFPWLALALGFGRRSPALPVVVLALACVLGWARGVFDVPAFYRAAAIDREGDFRCLDRQLGSGLPIICPGFAQMGVTDLTRAYVYARDIGASFVRYLPIIERPGFGREMLAWHEVADFSQARWFHVRDLADGWRQGEGDPQMLVTLPDAERLAHCRVLGVQLGLMNRQSDALQVFYRFTGQIGYSEARSLRESYSGRDGVVQRWEFSFDSPTGFEPQLRIDPVDGEGQFKLTELRISCRLQAQP